MSSAILMLIAIVSFAIFILLMLLEKQNKNRVYLKFVIIAYPILTIDLLPSLFTVTIFDFITIVFLILFFEKKIIENKYSIYNVILLVFAIAIICGLYMAGGGEKDTKTAVMHILTISVLIRTLIIEVADDTNFRSRYINCLKITLILSFIFLLIQLVFGAEISLAKSQNINVTGGISNRYPSFFQDPQKYAQFLAAVSFAILYEHKNNIKNRYHNYMLVIASVIAIMLSGGRAGLGGWVFGAIIILLFSSNKVRVPVLATLIAISTIAYNFSAELPIFKRASLEESYEFRELIWKDAINIFYNNPIVGIGIGNYANYVSEYYPDQYWLVDNEIVYYDHPESGYLKILTETGISGSLLFLLLISIPIVHGISRFTVNKNRNIIFLIAGLMSWIVGFYTVYSLGDIRIMVLISIIISLLIVETNDNRYSEN